MPVSTAQCRPCLNANETAAPFGVAVFFILNAFYKENEHEEITDAFGSGDDAYDCRM
jgi:hypothetical protein